MGTGGSRARPVLRWLIAVAALALAAQVGLATTPQARAASINPRDLATTDDEAGRQAGRAIDKDGSDERSVWVQLRWERDREGPDFNTGPATVENSIWVAKDLVSARAIYQEQAAHNKDFPEAFFAHKGDYALPISGIGDEISGLSSCRDCNSKDDIFLHHRVTFRRGIVVGTLYLYGSDATAPQSLMSWFAIQVVNRIPDSAAQAPERAGQESTASGAPPSGDATQAQPTASPAPAAMVQANPKDLVIKIGEAGKGAKIKSEKDGTDARGNWFEMRYEREGSGSRFYQGPVTIYNYVLVARDIESARQAYQEKVGQNDQLPEADRRVGQKFELKDANEVGEEGAGISACERSCNSGGDIYVHKRLVSRFANVVSVVYLWGLSNEDGTTDWHARFFGALVVDRVRGQS